MAIKMSEYTKTKHTGLKIHKSGDKFLFDVMLNDKRFRKTYKSKGASLSKADKLKQAYQALEQFIKNKDKELNTSADTNATVNTYYDSLKASNGWSAKTTATYDGIYNKYINGSLGIVKIVDVTPAMLTRLNTTTKHLAKGSAKKIYDILTPIFNLAIEDEIIDRTPIKKGHVPKRDQLAEKKVIIGAREKYKLLYTTLQQIFNSNDTVIFADGTQFQCSVNPHHLALFLFGFHGRRLTETVSLKWDDIDFATNQYKIRGTTSKIDTDMVFTLPQDIRSALEEFADTQGNVFRIKDPKKYYTHIRNVSGMNEFSFHWMRNLAVSALSSAGVSATELSAMLGHTDATTLRKYLSLQREAATQTTSDISRKMLMSEQG